jgi:tRNA 2-thiouridine synthesizing protein D
MSAKKTFTFVLMDPPHQNRRTTTALRLIDLAVRRGHDVNVFAYEGAVFVPFEEQAPNANAVYGRDVEIEDHPNPKEWVDAIFREAARLGSKLDWVQCGLAADERGAAECISGPRRGSPADLVQFASQSHNTLVSPTK